MISWVHSDLMDSDDLAWIAGFLEGEGFFSRQTDRKGRIRVLIGAISIDKDVLDHLARTVPHSRVNGPYTPAKGSRGKKLTWRWVVCLRQPTVELATRLRPLMCNRRQGQIDALLAHAASKPPSPAGRPSTAAHGTRTRYSHGCRCQDCREAENSYQRNCGPPGR